VGARILVTGVANVQGARLAAALVALPGVDRVVGLDTRPPGPQLSRVIDHVQADVRSQDLGRLLRPHRITVIVHNDVLQFPEPGRAGRHLHDINVIGTLSLLTAAGTLPELTAIVVRGSAAIYGAEPADRIFWNEEDVPPGGSRVRLRTRFQRDVAEIEQLVDVFARRHHEVACTLLRVQPVVGGELDTPFTRLVRARVVPTYLGFDPRVQVIHLDDATAVLAVAARKGVRGTVNVAAPGPVSLSRALRRIGRPRVPLAGPAYGLTVGLAQRVLGFPALSVDMERYLRYGRVVDTARQEQELGVVPERDTLAALVATAREPRRALVAA
jgi:UDP-glucose 4-epimerase